MKKARVTPYYDMEVWDWDGGYIKFDKENYQGESELGHIVENRIVQGALHEKLKSYENVTLYRTSIEVSNYSAEDDRIHVVTKEGNKFRTRLLVLHLPLSFTLSPSCTSSNHFESFHTVAFAQVGADGGNSTVRKDFGLFPIGWSYNQKGVVCTVELDAHSSTAWQKFLPTGPLALLPVNVFSVQLRLTPTTTTAA
jgi:2-polyprenyl-6-methoxyphenol hydroxylase-like FAD-dependent oxidoreductase